MRWRPRDPHEWKRWFAWHPVKLGRWTYWLETVERRFCGEYYEVRTIPYVYDGMP